MKEIYYDRDVKTMPEALGIPIERAEDIGAQMASVMYRAKSGKKKTTLFLMEEFVKIARTEEERLYCAWAAGGKSAEIAYNQNNPLNSILGEIAKRRNYGDGETD